MSVPLDRLYHYIENIAQEIYKDYVLIYRFFPHGSKNIKDLNSLYTSDTWVKKTVFPGVWCNDQEPLDYDFYKTYIKEPNDPFNKLLKFYNLYIPPINLNYRRNIFEKNILLHSEQRSINVKKYYLDNELIPVYYWSHAILSRDWFRYAKHETFQKSTKKIFLIYNRAWSGTREYRLKFAEYVLRLGLEDKCKMSLNPIEPELGIHYELHKFSNPVWRPNCILENYFPKNTAESHCSADFDTNDYNNTDIEVVLETLFDDDRLHLTEKSLRPVACGQPFILAGTHGSLEYLRSYGFKTFGHIWDERYDQVEDPKERLIQIADLIKQIANWLPETRESKMAQAQSIADYNRKHFFSKEFFDQIISELKTNLIAGFEEQARCNNYQPWIDRGKNLMLISEITNFLNANQNQDLPSMASVNYVIQQAQNKLTERTNMNQDSINPS